MEYYKGTCRINNNTLNCLIRIAETDEEAETIFGEQDRIVVIPLWENGMHYAAYETKKEFENAGKYTLYAKITETEASVYISIKRIFDEFWFHDRIGGFPNKEKLERHLISLSKNSTQCLKEY